MNWSEIFSHDKRTLINYKIRNIIRDKVYKSSINLLSNLTLYNKNQKNYINKNFIRKKYCDILNKFQSIKNINKKDKKPNNNNINNRYYLKINNNISTNYNIMKNYNNKTLLLLKNKKNINFNKDNKNINKSIFKNNYILNKNKSYDLIFKKEDFEKIRIENNQKYYKNKINYYLNQSKKYFKKNEENKILNNLSYEKDFIIDFQNIKNIYTNLDKKYTNQKKLLKFSLKKNNNNFLNNSNIDENFLNNYEIYDKSTDLLIKSIKIKINLLKKLNELN